MPAVDRRSTNYSARSGIAVSAVRKFRLGPGPITSHGEHGL